MNISRTNMNHTFFFSWNKNFSWNHSHSDYRCDALFIRLKKNKNAVKHMIRHNLLFSLLSFKNMDVMLLNVFMNIYFP